MDISGLTDGSFTTAGSNDMGERQKTPQHGTPVTDADTPQALTSDGAEFGPPGPSAPAGIAKDIGKIEEVFQQIGGLAATRRPDEANTTAGKGRELLFLKQKMSSMRTT